MRLALQRMMLALIAAIAVAVLDYWLPFIFRTVRGQDSVWRLTRPVFALLIVLALCLSPALRRRLPVRWTWSWVSVIPALYVAYNLTSVFLGLPKIVPGALRVILVLDGFAIGAIEEFFFRGVAFLGRGQATPKRTVLITAISFSVIHFVGLTTGVPIHNVLHVMIGALPIGILFGVIRLATGSIAWCICLHGAIDASAYLAGGGWRGWELANSTLFLVSVSSATILFFAHPKMRKSQARVI